MTFVDILQGAPEEGAGGNVTQPGARKKDTQVRRQEVLGEGADSLAGILLTTATEAAAELLRASPGADIVVELAAGGVDGI